MTTPGAQGRRLLGRRLGLLLLAAATLLGCQGRRATSPAGSASVTPLELSGLGSDRRTTLRALRMPLSEVRSRLGAHRMTCSSHLVTRLPGRPAQQIDQELTLRADDKGQFALTKNTHPQYGHEVIFTEGWLYPRLRWNRFLRRQAEPREPAGILDRAGLLPAYVALLRRFLAISSQGRATHLGREAVKIKLGLEPEPAPPRTEPSPARSWRRTVVARSLEGEALLDAKTGAPLRVDLRARWAFNPPAPGPLPPSGIPSSVDAQHVAETELRFSLRVIAVGKLPPVEPPPEAETIDSPRLTRTEIERQMLTGELPLEEKWGPP